MSTDGTAKPLVRFGVFADAHYAEQQKYQSSDGGCYASSCFGSLAWHRWAIIQAGPSRNHTGARAISVRLDHPASDPYTAHHEFIALAGDRHGQIVRVRAEACRQVGPGFRGIEFDE